MLSVEEAASFLGVDATSIEALTASGSVHLSRDEYGLLLICVLTLWQSRDKVNGSDFNG